MVEGKESQPVDYNEKPDADKENLSVEGGKKVKSKDVQAGDKLLLEEDRGKTEILDEASSEKIKDYANNYFNKALKQSTDLKDQDISNALREAQDSLNKIIGNEKLWQDTRVITPEFQKATKIFLDELLRFSEANKNDKNFKKFSYYLNNTIFNGTPNIISLLDVEDSFDFAVKATRIKELQGTIGGEAISGLIEKTESLFLYGSEEEKEVLYEIYKKNKFAEKLDELQVLESVAGNAMAEGGRLDSSEKGVKELLKKIKENENNSFFENCYIDLVLDRIKKEKEKKELPSFVVPGNPSRSRLDEQMPENYKADFEELSKRIYPDTDLKKGERIVTIGQDLIAIIDQSKTPIKFSMIDLPKREKTETGIDGIILKKIKDALDKNKEDIIFDKFAELANEGVIKPFYKINEGDFDVLGDKWSQFSGDKISKKRLFAIYSG